MNGFFVTYRQLAWGLVALPFAGMGLVMVPAIACKIVQHLVHTIR